MSDDADRGGQGGCMVTTVRPWPSWRFTPQPDITAYELARILAVTDGRVSWIEDLIYRRSPDRLLGPELLRHFTREG